MVAPGNLVGTFSGQTNMAMEYGPVEDAFPIDSLPEGNIAMKHPSFFHSSCQDRRTKCSIAMFDFPEG